MPRAGFSSARQIRNIRRLAVLLVGLIVSSTGCQKHYYYYYGNSGDCPPMGPASVVEGPVCDVSGQVIEGGTVVSSVPDEPVVTRSRKSKVVVSEADSSSGRKSSWKASDSESSVATQVDGAMDSSTRR